VKYLLDTNLCVAAMRNHPLVLQRLSALAPGECEISSITAYELFTGIEKCSDPARERPKVERLLQIVGQLPFDSAAASEAARIRGVLEKTGQSIGPYDMLLADMRCRSSSFWSRTTRANLCASPDWLWKIGKCQRREQRVTESKLETAPPGPKEYNS
jgi:tRNA(fMet)-specific endonuclease VapC